MKRDGLGHRFSYGGTVIPARAGLCHAANLLGALALAVTDRSFDAVAAVGTDGSGTDAIVLSALYQFLDRPTIDLLRRVLGLTSSGAVRW